MLVFALPLYADVLDKVSVGVEYSHLSDLELDSGKPLTVNAFGATLGTLGDLTSVSSDKILAVLQYNVSEYLNPYVVLGTLSLDYTYGFEIAIDDVPLLGLAHKFDDTAFAYGFGASGKVIDLPEGLKLTYDVRRLQTQKLESDETTTATIPLLCYSEDLVSKAQSDYGEWTVTLAIAREFMLEKIDKIKSITPYIGYKFSSIDMDMNQTIAIDSATSAQLEYSIEGEQHSIIAGANVAINDHVSAFINVSFIDERGVQTGVMYSF